MKGIAAKHNLNLRSPNYRNLAHEIKTAHDDKDAQSKTRKILGPIYQQSNEP